MLSQRSSRGRGWGWRLAIPKASRPSAPFAGGFTVMRRPWAKRNNREGINASVETRRGERRTLLQHRRMGRVREWRRDTVDHGAKGRPSCRLQEGGVLTAQPAPLLSSCLHQCLQPPETSWTAARSLTNYRRTGRVCIEQVR